MQADFWLDRWKNGEIGFHRHEVSPYLPQFWPSLDHPPPARVLVPLCGKSLDMLWLSKQGYQVLGVELSELAVEAFFAEANLKPQHSKQNHFECWQTENITILCGDFFDLDANDAAGCSLIYDRAALIALPDDLRRRYVKHLRQVCSSEMQMLLVVLAYPQHEMDGPPFSVEQTEISALFEGATVSLLQQQDMLQQEPRFRAKGVTSLFERVYALAWHTEKA